MQWILLILHIYTQTILVAVKKILGTKYGEVYMVPDFETFTHNSEDGQVFLLSDGYLMDLGNSFTTLTYAFIEVISECPDGL